ncbi:MAG TPA: DUF3592 domain-containing protein [Blastocatellia bacterium]|jgi:hypothetical protein|nr:DUF3592 domain-containing protein [Blastocatellia bacterium]
MNFGYTPQSFGFLILFGFGAAFALVILYQLARLIARLCGAKSDSLALGLFAGMMALLFFGSSLALDTMGERVSGRVMSRREAVWVSSRGGWRHQYQLDLSFSAKGVTPPAVKLNDAGVIEAFLKDKGAQHSTFDPDAATYDRMQVNDPIELRAIRVGGLSLVRDASRNTFTMLPWFWIVFGLVALALLILAWRRIGSLVIIAVVPLLVIAPLVNAWRDQRAADDFSAMTARATATVREVTRLKEWNFAYMRSRARDMNEFALRQHYDVVNLEFTPTGYRGPVIGVDAIDAPNDSAPAFAKGTTVEIRYDPNNPREARLDGRSRTWHWRDMLGVYADLTIVYVAIFILLLLYGWFTTRAKRMIARRVQESLKSKSFRQ